MNPSLGTGGASVGALLCDRTPFGPFRLGDVGLRIAGGGGAANTLLLVNVPAHSAGVNLVFMFSSLRLFWFAVAANVSEVTGKVKLY